MSANKELDCEFDNSAQMHIKKYRQFPPCFGFCIAKLVMTGERVTYLLLRLKKDCTFVASN